MITGMENWLEWRRLCALGRCAEPTRSALRTFAESKFAAYLEKYRTGANRCATAALLADAGDCWQLFESHITLGRRGDGKSLKHWIFSRVSASGDPALKIVQGGVKLIIRDVVRSHLAREVARSDWVSLDAPADRSGDSGDICVGDMIAAPAERFSDLESAELSEHAAAIAETIAERIDFDAKIVLLARQLGLPLSNAIVVSVAGKKKSMLSRIWHQTIEDMVVEIEESYSEEDREWRMALSGRVLMALNERIFSWARVEKCCAALLDIVGAN